MIRIKNTSVLESILVHPAHPKLVDLVKWVCVRYSEAILTGGYEERSYPSVHSMVPYRGMDMRSTVFRDPQAVADDINRHWEYDPARPDKKCAIYHDVGRGAHLHLQVHNNTKRKEGIS